VTAREVLDSIKEQLAAATPGQWRWDEGYGEAGDTGLALTNDAGAEIVGAYNHHCCSFRDDPLVDDNDAEFIAAAPSTVARLTAALEAVLSECDYLDTLADGDKHYAAGFRKLVTDALKEGP
jgi:hypothetical protein